MIRGYAALESGVEEIVPMRPAHRDGIDKAPGSPDRVLWQQCRLADAADDEGERFLDLAGFVEARLDVDEHERIAAFLAADEALAHDVAAAAALAAQGVPPAPPETVIARACALAGPAASLRPTAAAAPTSDTLAPDRLTTGTLAVTRPQSVVRFTPRMRPAKSIAGVARWGSLAAALALASWVGFAMGSNASLALSDLSQPDQGFINELFDPSNGFLRDLTDSAQT
jgi:hypothetical protein